MRFMSKKNLKENKPLSREKTHLSRHCNTDKSATKVYLSYRSINYKLPQGEFSTFSALETGKLGSLELLTVKDLIWGCLLGDAYCNPRGCITLRQGLSQAPYLFWKWETGRAAN